MASLIGFLLFAATTDFNLTFGDEPTGQSPPSASLTAPSETQVYVVTDDDFLVGSANAWCQRSLDRAIRQCETQRTKAGIQVKFIPAGAPGILNKARPKTGPRRAICLITDSQGLVYSFCVGVPSGTQLMSLLEDADDLLLSASMEALDQGNDPESEGESSLVKVVRERSAKRTIRHYLPLLGKIREDSELTAAAEILAPAVQLDLGERFHLTPPIDGDRLVSTQQHIESSRYWCDAILPCVVEKPIDTIWPELASIVWNAQPWRVQSDSVALTSWYEATIKDRPIVNEIAGNPIPAYLGGAVNAVIGNPEAIENRAKVDAELESKLSDIAVYKRLSLPEFATLLAHRKDRPIDILIDSTTKPRWWAIQKITEESIAFPAGAGDRLITQVERWAAN